MPTARLACLLGLVDAEYQQVHEADAQQDWCRRPQRAGTVMLDDDPLVVRGDGEADVTAALWADVDGQDRVFDVVHGSHDPFCWVMRFPQAAVCL